MDRSLWESLLDDINKFKEKDPPSADDAPRIQSLLRQVAALTGTAGPAGGSGATGEPAVQGLDDNGMLGLIATPEDTLTDKDLDAAASFAYAPGREKEKDPDAFEKRPEKIREFSKIFDTAKNVQGVRILSGQRQVLDRNVARSALKMARRRMEGSATVRTTGDLFRIGAGTANERLGNADVTGKRRYGSEDELKKALAAKGPGAFVVGIRPLGLGLSAFKAVDTYPFHDSPDGSRADIDNREVNHPHIFYLDADGTLRDAGYFDDGIRKGREGRDKTKARQQGESNELDNVGRYHFGDVENVPVLRPEMFDLKGFYASNYNTAMHNCQDCAEAIVKRLRGTR